MRAVGTTLQDGSVVTQADHDYDVCTEALRALGSEAERLMLELDEIVGVQLCEMEAEAIEAYGRRLCSLIEGGGLRSAKGGWSPVTGAY